MLDRCEELWVQDILERPYSLSKKGYAVLYVPGHPWASKVGQIFRSRYIMNVLGRLVDRRLVVHHRDRDKLNDHPDNLEVLTPSGHSIIHTSPIPDAQREKIKAGLRRYYERNRREIGSAMPKSRIEKLSESHKGILLSEEAKAKVSAAMKQRPITWGDKLSAALKGRKPSEKCEAARLNAIRGKPLSEEHKARLSEKSRIAMKRIWAERKARNA